MHIDAKELPVGKRLEADVAIIGAGAAGLVLAQHLTAQNRSVLLLESGGFQYEPETQKLYDGVAEGPAFEPQASYLASSRLRYYGGSTNHWGGWCRPLDSIDFETREWMPHSGWPIDSQDLAPHYRAAERVLEIPSFEKDRVAPDRPLYLLPESQRVTTKLFEIKGLRLRNTLGRKLLTSRAVVVSHANLTDIRLHPDGGSVESLSLASSPERRFEARASCYLLATGGIENARVLLASDTVHSNGIGNGNDLVGRYFMEHPHARVGSVFLTAQAKNAPLYVQRKSQQARRQAAFSLSDSELRKQRLPNAGLVLVRADTSIGGAITASVDVDRIRDPSRKPYKGFQGGLYARWEQVPNPASRVTLDRERDRLGMRRAHLRWQLTDEDARTIRRTLDILASELGRWATGRIAGRLDPQAPWKGVIGGNHHMGTTRMTTGPQTGVVDADCKVFGVRNLWIAGSSVFPTVGFANPTLTLLALAHRLAEHIDRTLGED